MAYRRKYSVFMTKLSVNINKIAVVRNSRGGNLPDVVRAATDIERFGADGITVHPRPDGRHIRYDDVRNLKRVLRTEFNIEGNPIPDFISLVCEVVPTQVTLVPDAPDALTSNAGWNTVAHRDFLTDVTRRFHERGIRVSIFVDPVAEMVAGAKACGADRVELYTEAYAREYVADPGRAVAPYVAAAEEARRQGLGLNAGARSLARESALLPDADSLDRRGLDRPCAHLRCTLLRTRKHRATLPTRTLILLSKRP